MEVGEIKKEDIHDKELPNGSNDTLDATPTSSPARLLQILTEQKKMKSVKVNDDGEMQYHISQPLAQIPVVPPLPTPQADGAQGDVVERSPGGRYVRLAEKLGCGAYKEVYRAYDTIEGIEVAWNVVKLSGTPKNDRSRIINEVRLLERLHHHNIISFHGSWVNREQEVVNFVTEILSSGTLKNFINKVQVIRWKIAKRWAIQILNGLEYLHSQNPPIIHRDLKCDNIFINGTKGDLRIGDFGLSTVISSKDKGLSVLGTPEFMAPELYDEVYDEKVDIYAFGMCLLEILTKEAPYSECANPAQIYKKVTKAIPPASIRRIQSKEARDFIMLCLGRSADGRIIRPSALELLQHPFLVGESAFDEDEVQIDPPIQDVVISEQSVSIERGSESEVFTECVESVDNFTDLQNNSQECFPSNSNILKDEDQHESIEIETNEVIGQPSVVEENNNNYDDGVMKLSITLPSNGHTQNVHFDFHLGCDDPLNAAKKLVNELNIPEFAAIEISETIGWLAHAAQIKQKDNQPKVKEPTDSGVSLASDATENVPSEHANENHFKPPPHPNLKGKLPRQRSGSEISVSSVPMPRHRRMESDDSIKSHNSLKGCKPDGRNRANTVSNSDDSLIQTQYHISQPFNSKHRPLSPTSQEIQHNLDEQEHDIVERSPGGRYLRFAEKLGNYGIYKDVYRAYDTIQGIEVAWHVVKLSGMCKSDRARIVDEVRLLERLDHPNIISFHGSWVNREQEVVNFATEIKSSGSLKNFINKVQVIRWKIAKRWATQILKALDYFHSQDPRIIHRDLKCENIFINGTSGDLCIGDFGLSTVVRGDTKNLNLSVLGTPAFMAPELYDLNYDEKVDIYSFGMCLLEIFTQEVPYAECTNPTQIYKKVINGIPPSSIHRIRSQEARDFITLCLGSRPADGGPVERPSAHELLEHPFLKESPDDENEVELDDVDDSVQTLSSDAVCKTETHASNTVSEVRLTSDLEKSKPPLASLVDSKEVNDESAKKEETSKPAEVIDTTANDTPNVNFFAEKTADEETKKEAVTVTSWQSHAEKSFLDFVSRSNALIASLAKLHSNRSENNDGNSFSDTESVDSTKEELKLLEQKYKKSIEATKDAFDARKDNLQRAMVEKEAQHLFTLEKLEKDMAEYEKRLKLAEEQKQKRIEQMELEWKRQREMLTEKKKAEHENDGH